MEINEIVSGKIIATIGLLSASEITDLAYLLYERCDKDKFHKLQHQEILQELRDRQAMRKEIFN